MSDLLRKFFGGREADLPEAPPRELNAGEASLRFVHEDGRLTVAATFHERPLFSTGAVPLGQFRSVRTERQGLPAVVLNLPVRSEDRDLEIRVTYVQFGPHRARPGQELVRATRRRIPNGEQALEFTFGSGGDQVRYLVEMSQDLRVEGFCEVARTEAVFAEAPPVSQMVAFLKATLHQRRTALRSLQGLSRRCDDLNVRPVVDHMAEVLSQGHDFSQPRLVELRRTLEAQGRPAYANTVTALTLMADIHLGNIDHDAVDRVVAEEIPLEVSEDACEAVKAFLGAEDARPTSTFSVLALDFLRSAVAERSALTILSDLGDDSGSAVSRARVARLLERVAPDQNLANDEQEALRSYLAACGRAVHPDTLAALCLYIDFEAGIVTEEDIDSITPTRAFIDHSLYALVAVAAAFEADLRCFRIPEEEAWKGLKFLSLLGHHGVLARFLELGESGFHTRHLPDPAAVEEARARALVPTGEVLVALPVLEHLDVADLETFVGKGISIVACYQSEDRHVCWRRADPQAPRDPLVESVAGPFGFIDGFRVYRFHGRAIGRLVEVPAEKLRGQARVVAVYVDHRGNRTYHRHAVVEDVAVPPKHGVEWSGQVAVFPGLDGCPESLAEPGQEYLLGRPEEVSGETERLNRCYRGVQAYLTRHEDHQPPASVDRLRRTMRSGPFRSLLMGIVDPATRNSLTALLGKEGEPLRADLRFSEPLRQALDNREAEETAALVVLHELCRSDRARLPGRMKFWRPQPFRELLQDRLFTLAESLNPASRAAACRLLGTSVVADPQACAYVLSRHLDDPAVGGEAAVALAALALAPALPPPSPVTLPAEGLSARSSEAAEAEELAADLRGWLAVPGAPSETPARANLRGEERKLATLARLMARVNDSFRQDGSLARLRRVAVLSAEEEKLLRKAVMAAWKTFAAGQGLDLEKLGEPALYEEFRPTWQGARLETHLLSPGEILAVRKEEPLFLRLASLISTSGDEGQPTLLRLPQGDGAVDPGRCEVFRDGWQPFLHGTFAGGLGLGWAERSGYDGLSAFYAKLPAAAPGALEAGVDEPRPSKQYTLAQLGEALAQDFNLPRERRNAAYHMLLGLGPECRRRLPPA